MYEYAPLLQKGRVRAIAILLLLLGFALFGFSQINGLPFPIIYQFLGLLSLAGFIVLVARYLMRRYVYCVAPREDGMDGELEFTVTEYYGRRICVVCRISVSAVEEILPVDAKNKKRLNELQRGRLFYDYTADIFASNRYLLVVVDGDHRFCARILADDMLLNLLKKG